MHNDQNSLKQLCTCQKVKLFLASIKSWHIVNYSKHTVINVMIGDRSRNELDQMRDDLDAMFKKMNSPKQRQKKIENHTFLTEFGQTITEKQQNFLEIHQHQSSTPPAFDQNWSAQKTVKQANSQFRIYSDYVQQKEKEIDRGADDLILMNNEIVQRIDEIFQRFHPNDKNH